MKKLKTLRLTNQVRDEILKRIVDDQLRKQADKIAERRFSLSTKVYNDIYSKAMRDKMEELDNGWLPETTEFVVQFGGTSSGACRRMLREKKRFLHKHVDSYNRTIKVYEDEHRFTKEHDEITREEDKLAEQFSKAKMQAKAVVYSCNTTKTLKEVWPEIADIVSEFEPKGDEENGTSIIPVITGLNELLGLVK